MTQAKIDILERALKREKAARKEAEKILEQKSTELYYSKKKLEKLYKELASELTKTDSQLQGVFENIVDAYVVIDLSGNILKMNSASVKLLEFDSEKDNENLMNMVFPEDLETISNSFKLLLDKGSITDFEIKIKTKQNKTKLVHINASVIYDNDKPIAAQGIVRDITKSKEEEVVIQLINNIAQSILGKLDIYDIAFEIVYKIADYLGSDDCSIYLYNDNNHTLEQIADYGEKLDKKNRLVNKYILEEGQGVIWHTAKTGNSKIVNNTNIDSSIPVNSEITVPIKIGNKIIGIINSKNKQTNFFTLKHLEMLNNIAALVALQLKSAIDLMDRQKAEEELIESEERLSTLILNLNSGVLLEDENRKIVLTNKSFCDFFKIPASPEQLIGADCSNSAEQSKSLFQNPEQFVKSIDRILSKKEMVLSEEIIMASGKILERDYIPIYRDGSYKGHLWKYTDVTLKRQYRKSIEAERQKYRSIITNMNLGLLEVNTNDEILMVNQSFEIMSGYTSSELLGKAAGDIFTIENDKEIIQKENVERLKGHFNSYELRVKNRKGELRHWLISGAPNYNLNGEVIGSIGIHLDITDLKTLQLQKEKLLIELEKSNDELQEYAHVVSHDLKSPLRSIYALVSWIKEDNTGKLDDVSLDNFKHIENSLEKMEQLITTVLNYSKAGVDFQEHEDVDTNEMVNDVLNFLYVPKNIVINILNPLPIVRGDKIKLQQVFQNVISNAIKYTNKDKGLVEIDFEESTDYFKFIIRDNGIGIEKQYHEKIFKIFHALNQSKDSTGIGLSIVKKIVNLHKGQIWLDSIPNEGSTFYFTIKK